MSCLTSLHFKHACLVALFSDVPLFPQPFAGPCRKPWQRWIRKAWRCVGYQAFVSTWPTPPGFSFMSLDRVCLFLLLFRAFFRVALLPLTSGWSQHEREGPLLEFWIDEQKKGNHVFFVWPELKGTPTEGRTHPHTMSNRECFRSWLGSLFFGSIHLSSDWPAFFFAWASLEL